MKICVFGAGSVAGMAAARMARAGIELSLVARGAHLQAIQAKGLTLVTPEERFTVHPTATGGTASLGIQDVLVIGLKGHQIAPALEQIRPLVGPETVIVPTINGIPWWYGYGLEPPLPRTALESVDPGGRIADALPPQQVLGCVVYVATNIPEPGLIGHGSGGTYAVGEPVGGDSERRRTVAALFEKGGLKSPYTADIRETVWTKILGNLSGNPISILTRAHCLGLVEDAAVAGLMTRMMEEAFRVAEAQGIAIPTTLEARIQSFRDIGPYKTSMLQDFEAGKRIELDPILGAVIEMGRMLDIPTPQMDTVYALARQCAALDGCYAPPGTA